MVDIGTYEDFLKVLETNISEHEMQVEKMMVDAETEDDKIRVEELRRLTSTIGEALRNKDIDTLNKIISNASNPNK